MTRPNILFINTDQQSWDAISAYGNSWLRTPNIDRLVENGVSFMRSYCTDPVCAPARASWATGLYSSEVGVPFNGGSLYDDLPDVGQVLNAGGYRAFHSGKWHVPGRNARDSFRCLYFGQRNIAAGGAEMYDTAITHSVLDFLSSYREDEPFFLQVGLINPHDVCECAHYHEGKRIPGPLDQGIVKASELPPLPGSFDYDERETVTQIVMRRGRDPLIHKGIMNAADEWDELQWRFLLWNYFRFVEKVDLEIGLILNALEASPFRENTLVVFTSDHGEAAGAHRMIQKFTLYEESIRVPFIVASLSDRFAIEKNTRDDVHLVSGVDVLPTVLDYAGVDGPANLPGRSLRPLVEHEEADWPGFAYAESNCWGRAIVTPRYKYVTEYVPKEGEDVIPGPDEGRLGLEQLFDLEEDPDETSNLAGRPEHQQLLRDLRKTLLGKEGTLKRRALRERPARHMERWSTRVRAYWENHPQLMDARAGC